jgi:hypothetical protein
MNLPEQFKIVNALAPAADAAGRTGAYVSLKNAHRVFIVAHLTQGNAAAVTFSPMQASAVAGTGKKAVPVVPVWSNLDTAASDALVRRTDGASYETDAGLKLKQVIFQVDTSKLDLANGFDCITVETSASHAANITSAQYFIETRYPQATPPTAVTD